MFLFPHLTPPSHRFNKKSIRQIRTIRVRSPLTNQINVSQNYRLNFFNFLTP